MDQLPVKFEAREFWEFFCPVCRAQRRSFYWPSPRRRHYISLGVFALVLAMAFWPWIGGKGLFLGLPFWAIFEFYYRAKARQSLVCPHCGFDPYLYKYDIRLARRKMEKFWEPQRQALNEKLSKEKSEEDARRSARMTARKAGATPGKPESGSGNPGG